MLRLMPDFETLHLPGAWRASDAMFWNLAPDDWFQNITSGERLSGAWRLISKSCVWLAPGRRLAGTWRASDAMFWNHMSGAIFQNQASDATFQNLPPDAIFCDHASDVYHEWHSVGVIIQCNVPGRALPWVSDWCRLTLYNVVWHYIMWYTWCRLTLYHVVWQYIM